MLETCQFWWDPPKNQTDLGWHAACWAWCKRLPTLCLAAHLAGWGWRLPSSSSLAPAAPRVSLLRSFLASHTELRECLGNGSRWPGCFMLSWASQLCERDGCLSFYIFSSLLESVLIEACLLGWVFLLFCLHLFVYFLFPRAQKE